MSYMSKVLNVFIPVFILSFNSFAHAAECEIKKNHLGRAYSIDINTDDKLKTLLDSFKSDYVVVPMKGCEVIENPKHKGSLRSRYFYENKRIIVDNFTPGLSFINMLSKTKIEKNEKLIITVFARAELERTYSKKYYIEAIGSQKWPEVQVKYMHSTNVSSLVGQKKYVVITIDEKNSSQNRKPIQVYALSYIGVFSH